MKIVNSYVERVGEKNPMKKIELCGRVCYKSENKMTEESHKQFVKMLIKRGHLSVIEHVRFSLGLSLFSNTYKDILKEDKFLNVDGKTVEGNFRAWYEFLEKRVKLTPLKETADLYCYFIHNYPDIFDCIDVNEQTKEDLLNIGNKDNIKKIKDTAITFRIVCDRGISHELVRHRVFSFSQESTRYCNYGNKDIEFVLPTNLKGIKETLCFKDKGYFKPDSIMGMCFNHNNEAFNYEAYESKTSAFVAWFNSMLLSEFNYKYMISHNIKPEVARSILPNSLKTEIIMTGTKEMWVDFIKLRINKSAHPDMRVIAEMIKEKLGGENES